MQPGEIFLGRFTIEVKTKASIWEITNQITNEHYKQNFLRIPEQAKILQYAATFCV